MVCDRTRKPRSDPESTLLGVGGEARRHLAARLGQLLLRAEPLWAAKLDDERRRAADDCRGGPGSRSCDHGPSAYRGLLLRWSVGGRGAVLHRDRGADLLLSLDART